MTTQYLNIVTRPNAEVSASALLSSLFEQVHRELVARGLSTVGICFPDARPKAGLGERLRLHGKESELLSLTATPWLKRASDYYRIESPQSVPIDHSLCVVRRLQPKLSAAKIRRLLARKSVTEARAIELLEGRKSLDALYVEIKSGSSGQRFRLFFEQTLVTAPSLTSGFNTYGFGSTIPWF